MKIATSMGLTEGVVFAGILNWAGIAGRIGRLVFMDREQRLMPVIVLMDKETSDDRNAVVEWFENSRFLTCEAADVFEALEEISDFTTATRPDVILLDVESCDGDYQLVHDTIEPSTESNDLPILALAADGEIVEAGVTRSCFRGSLGQVAEHLDTLIPDPDISHKRQVSA